MTLQDLPTVVESYKTLDDVSLVKLADVGQVRGRSAMVEGCCACCLRGWRQAGSGALLYVPKKLLWSYSCRM